MPNLNSVHLMGNLTRDPETKFTPKGTAVCEIGLAINRSYTTEGGEKREETCFVDITFFNKTAETIGQYCKKGHPLYVQGRLALDTWEDKATGAKRSKLKIIGDNFQFLASKQDGEQQEQREPQSKPPVQRKPPVDPDLDSDDGDSLPF